MGELDPVLHKYFVKACATDELPAHPVHRKPQAYVVNTQPISKPGEHWIALSTHRTGCEVLDSYGLDLNTYCDAGPLRYWLETHFNSRMQNPALQSIRAASCGHYAIVYLMCKAQGVPTQHFLNAFSRRDYVGNDVKVADMLEEIIRGLLMECLFIQ